MKEDFPKVFKTAWWAKLITSLFGVIVLGGSVAFTYVMVPKALDSVPGAILVLLATALEVFCCYCIAMAMTEKFTVFENYALRECAFRTDKIFISEIVYIECPSWKNSRLVIGGKDKKWTMCRHMETQKIEEIVQLIFGLQNKLEKNA